VGVFFVHRLEARGQASGQWRGSQEMRGRGGGMGEEEAGRPEAARKLLESAARPSISAALDCPSRLTRARMLRNMKKEAISDAHSEAAVRLVAAREGGNRDGWLQEVGAVHRWRGGMSLQRDREKGQV
jgi:hypothetical protein